MATITDVAKHADVSVKTVSRVLNEEPYVRAALRERVLAAVAELEYRPNLAARQLAGKRSFIIAYPFSNPSAAYDADVLIGAARTCRDKGYHLVAEPIELDGTATAMIERLLRTLRPDGIILAPPLCDMPQIVNVVSSFRIPLARVAGALDLYGSAITADDGPASEALMAHLVGEGHTRIGFIRPHPDHILAERRFDGYRRGLERAGLPLEFDLVRAGRFDVASGIEAADALFGLDTPPTAIFASNDDMALGVMQAARKRGMEIPDDIAIAGFDDSPASGLVWPGLTTIRQPIAKLGSIAARALLGEKVEPSELRNELVIRRSTLGLDKI